MFIFAFVCVCVFSQSKVKAFSGEVVSNTVQVEFTFNETDYLGKYSKINENQVLQIFDELGKCQVELSKDLGYDPTEEEIKDELTAKEIFTGSLDQKTVKQMLDYVDIKFTTLDEMEKLQNRYEQEEISMLNKRFQEAMPFAQDTKVLSPYVQYWSVKPKYISKPTHTCKVTISRVKNIATSQHSIQGISTSLTSGYGSSFGSVTSNTTARATVIGKNGLPAGENYYTMSASSGNIQPRHN